MSLNAIVENTSSQRHLGDRVAKTESLWEEVSCNLCGARDYKVKYEGTTDRDMEKLLRSYCASGNFVSHERLVECKNCRLVFTSPRLRQDMILKGYEEAEDPLYVSQSDGRIKSFERCLRAVSKFQTGGRILDVGAAAGFFLTVAKKAGWEVFGIEPSKYLSEYGNKNYGANITCGTIETIPQYDKPMDVITLWDVLEHTFDPTDVLERCNRLLKPGGLVVINYPNIGNWMARLARSKYWFILSVHLYYFVPKTIDKLLDKTGFEVLEDGPHYQWLQLGYLVYRLESYLPKLAKMIGKVVKTRGWENLLVPYYAAQTRVIARKVSNV